MVNQNISEAVGDLNINILKHTAMPNRDASCGIRASCSSVVGFLDSDGRHVEQRL